jgi:hypothetical protein
LWKSGTAIAARERKRSPLCRQGEFNSYANSFKLIILSGYHDTYASYLFWKSRSWKAAYPQDGPTARNIGIQCSRGAAPVSKVNISANLTHLQVQWVALRNINLLLQKRDDLLVNEMRVFFCKYNDPPYVKVGDLTNI